MNYQYSFINDVWNNLRKKIRNLGIESLWYKVLYSLIGLTLENRRLKLNYLFNQTSIDTCPAERLYLWGQRLGLPRENGEDLEDYRLRLIALKSQTEGISVDVKLKIISRLSDIEVENIRWKPVYPYHQTIGGVIGEPISTRDYSLLGFRFYMTDNGADWNKISIELEKINKNGEVCELWIETSTGSKVGVELGEITEKNYEIY